MPEPTLMIRRAQIDDARLLAELGAQTFAETFSDDNTPEDMAAYLASSFSVEKLSAELNDSSSTFFIAEVDGQASGYAKMHAGALPSVEAHKPIELVRLYVAQQWHGRGVGHVLMEHCIDAAREMGFETIWLGVWEHNSRAQAFYRKWNFREVGEHTFQLGADRQRDVVMQRSL